MLEKYTSIRRSHVSVSLLGLAFILALGGLYFYGATQQATHVNTNIRGTDQHVYIAYAKKLALSDYTYIGNRNQMPVYPFFQSLFYHPDLSDEAYFAQGKTRNIILSLFLLAGIFAIFRWRFPLWHSATLLMISAFTVFMFKAGYFQTELLFYFFSFIAFLLMSAMFTQPSWRLAITLGVVLGITHLTKASVLPGLVLFLVLYSSKILYTFFQNKRQAQATKTTILPQNILKQLLYGLLVVLVFLTILWPYISTSKRVFGQYFYNVNSTFYIWNNSIQEVWDQEKGTALNGDSVGWPDMPSEDIPSLSKYLREHTIKDIAFRMGLGFYASLKFHCNENAYGYCKYILITTLFTYVALASNIKIFERLVKKYGFLALFWSGYFVGYALLYFWYVPIGAGQRFMLALFLPYLFVISTLITTPPFSRQTFSFAGWRIHWATTMNGVLWLVLVFDIPLILSNRIVTLYAGN